MSSKCDTIRIAILGPPGNGKTAVAVKTISGRFLWNYDPTLEFIYKHSLMDIDKGGIPETYSLEILDTAGYIGTTDMDSAQRDSYIKWADAFILLYSVTNLQSFGEVKLLREIIMESKKLSTSIAIIGNKTDLTHLRQVDFDAVEKFANEHGCLCYEVSARLECQKTIAQPFFDLCRDVKTKRSREGIKLRRRSSASQLLRKLMQKKLTI